MATKRTHRPNRSDRLLGAERLSVQDGITADYTVGPVDRMAAEMDRKWGIDRLPDLVPVELAQRFGAQAEKFNRALAAQPLDLAELATQAQRMLNAYAALDRAAEQAGAPKASPEVWEFVVNGKRCALVRDAATAAAYRQDGGSGRVYTLDEIGRICALDTMRLVNSVKDEWPGATVTAVRPRSDLEEVLDDEIPF